MKTITDAPRVLENVPRVDSIERDEFIEKHVKPHRPLIIRGSQEGASISAITTEEEALEAFGEVSIQVQQNYTSPLAKGRIDVRKKGLSQKVRNQIDEMPLREYCDRIRQEPDTELLCVEYGTPDRVLETMAVPDLCEVPWSDEELVSFMFVANEGNYAHMHFDGDFRSVLLYQIFGRKRVVMVPLEEQPKIAPSMNHSKLLVQNMDEEEKLHLFEYLGAYDCIIEPGEMVYFPPSIWHYVEYVDTGMSVNFRFGRDRFAEKVIDANRVPFYPELHLMLARAHRLDEGARGDAEESIWNEVESVLGREYDSSRDRHYATQEMYRNLVDSLAEEGRRPPVVEADCLVAEAMAVERHDSPSKRWREELALGDPL